MKPQAGRGSSIGAGSSMALGIYLVIASLAVGALSYVALNLLYNVARDQGTQLPQLALFSFEQRAWLPFTVLPALVLGVLIVRTRGAMKFALLMLAMLLLLAPFALVMYCFFAVVAPMYQMQAL